MLFISNKFKHLNDLDVALNIFAEDIIACHNLALKQPDNQTWRRLLIRTIFTSIEFWRNNINQTSLDDYVSSINCICQKDALFLRERKLSKDGREISNTNKFGEYFEHTLRIHAAIQRVKFSLNKGSEWQLFLKAINIRNRITHPKKAADLILNIQEYKDAHRGLLWAMGCIKELFGLLPGNIPGKRLLAQY